MDALDAGDARAQCVDTAAEAALVREHLWLVRHVAQQAVGRVELEELESAGLEGLAHAARRFDDMRGVAFTTYAGPWIRKFVRAAIRLLAAPVRVPDAKALRHLAAVSWDSVEETNLGRVALAGGDLDAGRAVIEADRRSAIRAALEALDERTAGVLRAFYGLDGVTRQTQEELAATLWCSTEWVRRLLRKGEAALRADRRLQAHAEDLVEGDDAGSPWNCVR